MERRQRRELDSLLPPCFSKCPKHPHLPLSEICLNDCGKDYIFQCEQCSLLNESDQKLYLNEISFSQTDHVFRSWPNISDGLRKKIMVTISQDSKSENKTKMVHEFFEDLKSNILSILENTQKEFILKAQQVDSFSRCLSEEYNRLSYKRQFQEIIFNNHKLIHKSNAIKELIAHVQSHTREIETRLSEGIAQFQLFSEQLEIAELIYSSEKTVADFFTELRTAHTIKKSAFPLKPTAYNNIPFPETSKDLNARWIEVFGQNTANQVRQIIAEKDTLRKVEISINDIGLQFGEQEMKYIFSTVAQLKNVSILSLSLMKNEITNSSLSSLCSSIAQLKNIQQLSLTLSHNQISDSGIKAVSSLIQQMDNVVTLSLYLRNNKIGDEGAKRILIAVLQVPTLKTLHLSLVSNQISPNTADLIRQKITKIYNVEINI